jgi:hypothetical protein
MESMLNFVTKLTDVVKNHIEETDQCLGKEVVNSKANKTGICVDKIKVAYGAKFSMMGHQYKDSEVKQIESFNEDVFVIQGKNGYFFVPASSIKALGGSVILVEGATSVPEVNGEMSGRKQEVYRRFFTTKKAIKDLIPKTESARPFVAKKRRKLKLFY